MALVFSVLVSLPGGAAWATVGTQLMTSGISVGSLCIKAKSVPTLALFANQLTLSFQNIVQSC